MYKHLEIMNIIKDWRQSYINVPVHWLDLNRELAQCSSPHTRLCKHGEKWNTSRITASNSRLLSKWSQRKENRNYFVRLWAAWALTSWQWRSPPSCQISVSSIERGHNTCINVLITENSQLENCPVTTNTNTQHRPSAQIGGINV